MKWVTLAVFGVTTAALAAQDQATTALNWNEEGMRASNRGQYAAAEQLFENASQLWISLGPGYEAHLATSRMNQAQAICAQGNRPECARLLEVSVDLFRRSLGLRNERTLTSMNLLGGIYSMLGEYGKAESMFQQALDVEREFFSNDIQYARSLGGIAAMRTHDRKLDEALPLAEQALEVVLKSAGEETLDAALAYANVAEIHRAANRNDRALPLYRKSRALYERLLGSGHARVASILGQEGLILMTEGKLALADRDMQASLKMLEASCPDCIFEKWVGETNLGLLRLRQGKYNEADRLFTSVLAMQEKYLRQPSEELAKTLHLLASVRQKQRRFEDAERLTKRANVISAYK
jgi:tetratricopeptide (TPR) repeat protein